MARAENTIWCDNCGAEITWSPIIHGKHEFCCSDCYEGRGCDCGVRMEGYQDEETWPSR